jgi:hypothetical protein
MRLFQLKKGDKFQILYGGGTLPEVLIFDRIDGSYSICFDTSNQINHIAAYTEVVLVKEQPS